MTPHDIVNKWPELFGELSYITDGYVRFPETRWEGKYGPISNTEAHALIRVKLEDALRAKDYDILKTRRETIVMCGHRRISRGTIASGPDTIKTLAEAWEKVGE